MSLLASLLLLALTRAEIVERFRAAPVLQAEGLVQVWADCPAEMRREYQLPVAGFVSDVCRRLYAARNERPRRFAEPGIIVHLGDVTTNVPGIVVRDCARDDGSPFVRMYIPAPGYADPDRVRLAAARAFFRTVRGEEIDDARAVRELRAAYPELRVADEYRDLAEWTAGLRGAEDDERFLRLRRSVLAPGEARTEDVLTFASRLWLYPAQYGFKFAGTRRECSFREAVALAKADPTVRFAAYLKIPSVILYGGGRGARMSAAADAYAAFLRALAAGGKTEGELYALLDAADGKLKGTLE